MRSDYLFSSVASLTLALFLMAAPAAHAQIVSSGLTGVVRDHDGNGVPAATVTATHLPTGTVYEARTSSEGRYNFRGMIVGGPYSVLVKVGGFKPVERTVVTRLGEDTDVSFQLENTEEDVVNLEAFVVEAEANELDATATGAGNVYGPGQLESKPTGSRSLADMVSASPLVTLRAEVGDREEAQITAVGQNVRYNSIQIDGARINDQFGLNMTGLASFFNPLSLDTIEQLSVQVSPFDVRQAGFTGASINAVTKSGTNEFHGSVYYIFSGDEWLGVKMQGEDLTGVNAGRVPRLDRETKGFTLGGPILKNRLFFFVNYEEFSRLSAPGAAGLIDIDQGQANAILDRLDTYNAESGQEFNWGEFMLGTDVVNLTSDEKRLAKLDWVINRDHRLSLRYSKTDGELPQYGKYTNTTVQNNAGLISGGATALDTHIYSQVRAEEVWAGQLFSRWSDKFRTELKFSQTAQDQDTPLAIVSPEVTVFGLNGINNQNQPITNAAVVFGTEFSRQGNVIKVDSRSLSLTGDYFLGDVVLSGGIEREESDFYNVFRNGSYGTIVFASLQDFLDDEPARIERPSYDPALRPDAADISDFATTGLAAQAKWDVNSRLSMLAGVRFEIGESDAVPPFNATFFERTGFRNDGTVDGVTTLSPRFGFNYAFDEERTMQLRGGFGHFLGRAPWVIFSNSYNSPGVGEFTFINSTPAPGAMTDYLAQFDPENPVGTATDTGTNRRAINWADDKTKLPSVWRATLALDKRLSFLDSVISAEVVLTTTDQGLFIVNENLRPLTGPVPIGADGRRRFSGNPASGGNNPNNVTTARFPNYLDLYRITNTDVGGSRYVTLAWDRPMKDHWAANVSYVTGHSTEAQSFGQTTASGQWQRNVVFNQGEVEEGTSDFEIAHRYQLSLSREFEFIRNHVTRVSLYFERRSGDPYSFVYRNDLNGDGRTDNDLVAVPTGPDDPRFNFSNMAADVQANYFAFLEENGLSRFAGSYAPKNAFTSPWVNRLDLKISQTIPLHFRDSRLEVFMDFLNFGAFISEDAFGYYEEAPQFHFGSRNFRRRFLGNGTYDAQGRIVPTFQGDNFIIDNGMSRWKVQIGARLTF